MCTPRNGAGEADREFPSHALAASGATAGGRVNATTCNSSDSSETSATVATAATADTAAKAATAAVAAVTGTTAATSHQHPKDDTELGR